LEALTSDRAVQSGLVTQQPHPVAGPTHVLAPPYRMDGERLPIRHAPPVLGEATDEVLQSLLGLSAAQVSALHQQGVI
jgi:crotonobetainyl-CoA:carnitine CoA-transferase CaiB-like acyl-CoA transferase